MKRKKINISLILCAVFVAVLSCFAYFKITNVSDSVSADTVSSDYYFNGSSLLICCSTVYQVGGNDRPFGFGNFSFDINSLNGSVTTRVYGGLLWDMPGGTAGYNYSYATFDSSFVPTTTSTYYQVNLSSDLWFNVISFISSPNFSPNIYKVRIYSTSSNSLYSTHVEYYDKNENYLSLEIYSYSPNDSTPSKFLYEDRTYFLNNLNDLTDNEYYNSGYTGGYNFGYSTGYADGEGVGYNNGYSVGQGVGFNSGYSEGLEDSNVYTFKNLIGAALDVPLNTFTSLFNFEILGVNLKDFLFAMFTICVVITIINLTRR